MDGITVGLRCPTTEDYRIARKLWIFTPYEDINDQIISTSETLEATVKDD